ncbi:MAG: hypothetical protein V3V00_11560 [Saprospiraceae bacterium]
MRKKQREYYHYSRTFKEEKVKMIEEGKITVIQLSKIYQVSRAAIYSWVSKYGRLPKTERLVVEKESEGSKSMEFLGRIKELEAALGRKDLENTYLRTVIEKANEYYKCDIEKKSC